MHYGQNKLTCWYQILSNAPGGTFPIESNLRRNPCNQLVRKASNHQICNIKFFHLVQLTIRNICDIFSMNLPFQWMSSLHLLEWQVCATLLCHLYVSIFSIYFPKIFWNEKCEPLTLWIDGEPVPSVWMLNQSSLFFLKNY